MHTSCGNSVIKTFKARHILLNSRSITPTFKPKATIEKALQTPTTTFDIQAKLEFLREDLSHLFDDKGIDANAYEAVVDFRDPITKYSDLSGYLFNIAFLKQAFNPCFELHDIWVSDPNAVTTRWTMSMELTATQNVPIIKDVFKPIIVFTGTSTYVFNPNSGKIFRHIDVWDSISNQEYFSIEGFVDFFKQLLKPYTTPDLESPQYTLLKRCKDYEIRRYEPFTVAESPSIDVKQKAVRPATASFDQTGASGRSGEPSAFQALASYLFGKNDRGLVMKMTTPVYSDSAGALQFVIGSEVAKDPPKPLSPGISIRAQNGGLYAVRVFNGIASTTSAQKELSELRAGLIRDKLETADVDWTLARYNEPSTPDVLRRNEILLKISEDTFQKTWR
ncbi:hypothetical protein CEUSTIGMA_g2445.t1 [Chlamydomonas eustigma]|uniref:SOUL heme-binding protein n=1 Tax=Chlamydomonas eustigma TaxID=1157962 RepID=A0A250WWB6_9CHLO|nr:hypothetical protein CEUSTIGMA_g2445.t1 [Chlamydomonas eustigma]|eukprot:GAX74999.1 hypothetical protein CEUSTIGMA_g2445.t1 [Chlamydomonas eustigma]